MTAAVGAAEAHVRGGIGAVALAAEAQVQVAAGRRRDVERTGGHADRLGGALRVCRPLRWAANPGRDLAGGWG